MAKAIGALAAAAGGKVDGVIITGGIAYGKPVQEKLAAYCGWIAPLTAYPGEGELEALAQAGLGVVGGEYKAQEYK